MRQTSGSCPATSGSYLWTTTSYDGADRPLQVTAPDRSTTVTHYQGSQTFTKDPAGKNRVSQTDGLGRLISVTENSTSWPGESGVTTEPVYTTTYTYDLLDNLTGVNQSGQTRTFSYDSLKRLVRATNPESGTISYTYDDSGNLTKRTDARNVVKQFSAYDGLNRVTGFSYSGETGTPTGQPTPSVAYQYCDTPATCKPANMLGRLTSIAVSGGTTTGYQSYDYAGRVTSSSQTPYGKTPYTFSKYTYNLAGALTSEQYPSGRKVTTGYDTAGRPSSVSGALAGVNTAYVQSVAYAPHGGINQIKLQSGLYEETCYNTRLQPTAIRLGSSSTLLAACQDSGADALNLTFGYGPAGANNGNIGTAGITARAPNATPVNASQAFAYDAVNRLSVASESGVWSRNYRYDAFGNGWVWASSGQSLDSDTPQASSNFDANNRLQINQTSYDNAGNQTAIGGYTNVYDAENRLWTSTLGNVTTTYGYDGEGRRVQKAAGTSATVYVYDAGGSLAAEYATQPAGAPCATCYLTADHLGSTRVLTDASGTVKSLHDYLPFGEEIAANVGGRGARYYPADHLAINDGTTQKFTGKERDAETGLDYFEARYLSSAQGRFTSPDWSAAPEPVPYANFEDPQTLNLYTYVRNNPLSTDDPTGHCPPCVVALESPAFQQAVERAAPYVSAAIGATVGLAISKSESFRRGLDAMAANGGAYAGPYVGPLDMQLGVYKYNKGEQPRTPDGKFAPKQPGQSAPGADAEKDALEAEGATKTGTTLPGTDRKVDGTVTATGQKIEVKSGGSVNNTDQLVQTGRTAMDATGQPLLVVTTKANVKVAKPAQNNPNLVIRPVKRPGQQ